MSEKKLELSRRRILAGLGTIGVASAGAGAGTFALFSDEESSEDNTVQAGTLNLEQAGTSGSAIQSLAFEDLKPAGEGDSKTWTLNNQGSIGGYLSFALTNSVNGEGTSNDAESNDGGKGELGEWLDVTISIGESEVASGKFNELWDGIYDESVDIGTGSAELTVEASVPREAGNEIQGDVATGDIELFLFQTEDQSPGTTYDLVQDSDSDADFGSGNVAVMGDIVSFDSSGLTESASNWTQSGDNVGFWFGTGAGSTDTSDKVELKYRGNSGWQLLNDDTDASLDDFEFSLSDEQFNVQFDDTKYTEFGLFVEQNVNSGTQLLANATPSGEVPFRTALYEL